MYSGGFLFFLRFLECGEETDCFVEHRFGIVFRYNHDGLKDKKNPYDCRIRTY